MPRLTAPRLTTRLFLGVLGACLLVALLMGGATRWNFERGFIGYLNEMALTRMAYVQPRLEQAYAEHGNWDFLRGPPQGWFELLRPVPGQELPAGASAPTGQMLAADLTGTPLRAGLLDSQGQWVTGYRNIDLTMPRLAVRDRRAGGADRGEVVGWLVIAPFESVGDGAEQRFESAQDRALALTALLVLGLAAALAWWLSRVLLRRVRQVAAASHRLAAGDAAVRVPVSPHDHPRDEVARLAANFNHLAVTLERNEALRREFMADVSHELRTPLAVLRSELEALEDGIRPLDAAAVRSLQADVARLGQLVDDVYQLALADAGALSYRMQRLDLAALLQRVGDSHRGRLQAAGLALTLDLPAQPAWIEGDAQRLQQLLDNLLENARRYTDAPGQVRLRLVRQGRQWHLALDDSPPGVPEGALALLFERFFRVDASRQRTPGATGGAGLGLAIARAIVLAHGGHITAEASELGGLGVRVVLPESVD